VTSTPAIIRAETGQVEQVSALIAEAFEPLEVAKWLVRTDERRGRIEAQFRILVAHAFVHGHIDLVSDLSGAAVWFHVDGEEELPPPPDYDARLAAACGPYTERFQALDAAFADHHPHGVAHHHLALLAVAPDRQRDGIGSALLGQHHAHLDGVGVGAYLEASSPESRALYERHGYRVRGGPFSLPDGPPLWPMWREPVSA
jgi:GNAT superfamily N-acetyltransferase